MMDEVRRLVEIGFPIEDAICICSSMRRENSLEAFIRTQEEEYRLRCAKYVEEVMD